MASLRIAAFLCSLAAANASKLPNLVFVLADDLGHNDIGYMDPKIQSPELDKLAHDGVRLSTCYTWSWCAPSRGALMSGRYPPNTGYEKSSDGPSKDGKSGVPVFPLKYDLLPKVLKAKGYRTVMAGKWHLGYARAAYTPENRGFDEFFGYLTGAEDYYTHVKPASDDCKATRDLWHGVSGKGAPVGNKTFFAGEYSTKTYTDFLVQQIDQHDTSVPLFMYAAYQGVHGPLEVPKKYFSLYSDSKDCEFKKESKGFKCKAAAKPYDGLSKVYQDCACNRAVVMAQVTALSEGVGQVTSALKRRGMWNNTVLVFMGDNGGPTFEAHSNTPLRGGKFNFFEGGIRPATFVTSPLLPQSIRGTQYDGIVHETDWLPTFAGLAGAPVPKGIDGVDFWPTLLDASAPHRDEVLIADNVLRQGKWKLMTGADQRGWKGMLRDCTLGTGGGWSPIPTGKSSSCPADAYSGKKGLGCLGDAGVEQVVTDDVDKWLCSEPCTLDSPCLWDLESDPQEAHECSANNPDVIKSMLKRLKTLQQSMVSGPGEVVKDNGKFCKAAKARSVDGHMYIGPWVDDVDGESSEFLL